MEAMEQHLGIALPKDLEADVAAGKRTPDQAAEIAKLRADKALLERQNARTQTATTQARQKAIVGAVGGWVNAKQKTDLGFKPKAVGSADGLWELVDDRFARLVAATPPATEADAVALAEQAYTSVKAILAPVFKNVVVPKKTLNSNGSSAGKTTKPRNLDEVAMQFAGTTWRTRQ